MLRPLQIEHAQSQLVGMPESMAELLSVGPIAPTTVNALEGEACGHSALLLDSSHTAAAHSCAVSLKVAHGVDRCLCVCDRQLCFVGVRPVHAGTTCACSPAVCRCVSESTPL
jgi:hypothetical protein